MAIGVGAARAGDGAPIEHEVAAVRAAVPAGALLTTVIDMPLLPAQEAALAAERGGAHSVNTSTGFKPLGLRGTTPDNMRLPRSVPRPKAGTKWCVELATGRRGTGYGCDADRREQWHCHIAGV